MIKKKKDNFPKGRKVKCTNCDYEWTTLSEKINVTCPNCLNKTEVKK